jgi:SNF2 family DNA or RNA helicase
VTEVKGEAAWPPGRLFHLPWQIPFQLDGITRAYFLRSCAMAWDTGVGKSVAAIVTAACAAEAGEIGRLVIVCEPNKLGEWAADVARFAPGMAPAVLYHGGKRKKLLESLPRVLVTTYETARDDLAVFPPPPKRKLADGPLLSALLGTRTMVVYDEAAKFRNRSSHLYRAHEYLLRRLRQADPDTRVLALTATPMETSLEDVFSELRLVLPAGILPTVDGFCRRVIKYRDPWGRPTYRDDGAEWFRDLVAPYILRKRKTDPDVRAQFPEITEEFLPCLMRPDQMGLYQRLEDLAWDENGDRVEVPGLANALRLLAGDPMAILEAAEHGESEFTRMVAATLEGELRRCSSAKAEQLLARAALIAGEQGSKMIVFTFYGQTVLPVLVRKLEKLKAFPVWPYHGGMTPAGKDRAKDEFRAHPGGAVLVASDAGARGINIPEASYVDHYDAPRTWATAEQRVGRASRLGHTEPITSTCYFVEKTLESRSGMTTLLDRNKWSDFILGDGEEVEGRVSAGERRQMFSMSRMRRNRGQAPVGSVRR